MIRGQLVVVGVGPGDPELLTLKAVRALGTADVIAYPRTRSGTMAADTAATHFGDARRLPFDVPMTGDGAAETAYDNAAAQIRARLAAGETVALLCEGDPLTYGSAASLMERLSDEAISVVPGITAAAACAATVGVSLARGDAPLTIVPASAPAVLRQALAGDGGVVVYKLGRHGKRVRDAVVASGRSGHAVTHATLPGETVTPMAQVSGTLPYFSCAVLPPSPRPPAAWDGKRVALVAVTSQGAALGRQMARMLDASGLRAQVHARKGRADGEIDVADTPAALLALFREGVAIVAVMAAGIVVRALGPLVSDKRREPPVLCVAEDGSALVPLLGTHGGGGRLAHILGEALGVAPAITTMGDVRFGVALDDPPAGYRVADAAPFRELAADLAAGAGVRADPALTFLSPLPAGEREVAVSIHPARTGVPTYIAQRVALGMGASRGADPLAAVAAADEMIKDAGIDPHAVAVVASLDVKADEPALHAVASHLGVPLRVFDAKRLRCEEPRLATPSEVVREAVGVAGVAEAAALAACGDGGSLMVPKRIAGEATFALGLSEAPIARSVGRARGEVCVVGLGPGPGDWRTPEATAALARADAFVGYTLYLDMVEPRRAPHQTRHDFPLGAEAERVRFALERAGEGQTVALISSGDPGIYAMATLAAELLEGGNISAAASRVALTVVPGVSAAQAAAARVGAPLGHDFCFISLSDLLTPWPAIEARLRAAAAADFVVALYNPRSQRRTSQLVAALAIFGEARPPETPVVIASNVGRSGETIVHCALESVDPAEVDMLSVVLIGNSQTRAFDRGDGTRVVYTPRGYQVEGA